MRRHLTILKNDSLVVNAILPMLGTGIMAGCGFIFWLIATRLYPTADVGLAGTLVSVMTTLATFSLVGFDTGTIRFLASSPRKQAYVSTGFTLITIVAATLASGFVLILGFIAPGLTFIHEHVGTTIAFIGFATSTALNMYADAVFLSYRSTKYTLAITTTSNVLKIGFPFVFIPWGAFGIFTAAASAQLIGFVVSAVVLHRKFGIRITPSIDRAIVRTTWRYSVGNYLADFFAFLPGATLPVIVVNRLGAHESAYYYIVTMIVGLLYVIPSAVNSALFSEGSNDSSTIRASTKKAMFTVTALLVPAMFVLFFGGGPILSLFGTEYSTEGLSFLTTMTLCGIGVAISSLYATLFRLNQDIRALFVRNISFAASTITIAYSLLPLGLVGVGVAYISGTIVSIVGSVFMYHTRVNLSDATYAAGGKLGRFARLPARVYERCTDTMFMPLETFVVYRVRSLMTHIKRGSRKTVLFYPEVPKTYHILYKICRGLGYSITGNISKKADCVIRFEDTTRARARPELEARAREQRVVNLHCTDISKTHVEEVFREVFGYSLAVDPRTHTGVCVRKSDTNAVHDGRIVPCPTEPEPGYVYQQLIDARADGDLVWDLRICVFGDTIPIVLKRYKKRDERFTTTVRARLCDTESALSQDEQALVTRFCRAIGMDYGELDALRDPVDNRLYIVDANNTPAGPVRFLGHDREEFPRWFDTLCSSFEHEFFTQNKHYQARATKTMERPSLATRIMQRCNEVFIWPLSTVITCKRAHLRALAARRFNRRTVVCYPDRPRTYHALYKICHTLGYRITNRLVPDAACVVRFKDVTRSEQEPELLALEHAPNIINLHCTDISKTHVEEVFREVFGYSLAVDPRTHTGVCVRKSDTNAVHDGRIVPCPTEPEPGYVYQRLIPTSDRAGYACDIRVTVMGTTIPVVVKEYKPLNDQFNSVTDADIVLPHVVLTNDEQQQIIAFTQRIGLDFGELDVLRSTEDNRLYIVDANNTPSGPVDPLYEQPSELTRWFSMMSESFATIFLK